MHYHDIDEIWLWHEGSAEPTVGDHTISMRPGVLVYTPAGCFHGYHQHTVHSNTGITPRAAPSARRRHLHAQENGQPLAPAMPPFWLLPEENTAIKPTIFDSREFLQSAYQARYTRDQQVWQGTRDEWWALLVREGVLTGQIEDKSVRLRVDELLVAKATTSADLYAAGESEVAFAIGWPSYDR